MDRVSIRRAARPIRAASESLAPKLGVGHDLRNLCFLAAPAVVRALAGAKIPAKLVIGGFLLTRSTPRGHVWVEVDAPERWIVDVTASQFRKSWPRVVVLSVRDRRRGSYRPRLTGAAAVAYLRKERGHLLRLLPPSWWVTPPGDAALARFAGELSRLRLAAAGGG